MGLRQRIRELFASHNIQTFRYDEHGIHRSWNYDTTNQKERNAVKQFAKYSTAHGIPQRKLNVWTNPEQKQIYHSIRSFMSSLTHYRYNHYLVFPNKFKSSPKDESVYWALKFYKPTHLNPELHRNCAFKRTGTCNYCNGPNENTIG